MMKAFTGCFSELKNMFPTDSKKTEPAHNIVKRDNSEYLEEHQERKLRNPRQGAKSMPVEEYRAICPAPTARNCGCLSRISG
jgi:hypothetical protein